GGLAAAAGDGAGHPEPRRARYRPGHLSHKSAAEGSDARKLPAVVAVAYQDIDRHCAASPIRWRNLADRHERLGAADVAGKYLHGSANLPEGLGRSSVDKAQARRCPCVRASETQRLTIRAARVLRRLDDADGGYLENTGGDRHRADSCASDFA